MFNKIFKKDMVTLRKYKPIFITVDNVKHEGIKYNWIIIDRLSCGAPEYLIEDIISDGYIEDKEHIMYILTNVISVEWKVVEEKIVEDTFDVYQVYVK